MGLTAVVSDDVAPQRGDDLELEFGLWDGSAPIRAVARVAWTSRLRHDGRLGFGVQFRELSPNDRAQLARFLAAHRPRVIVAFASAEERALALDCLGDVELELVDRIEQLDRDLLPTCAAIFVFADRAERLSALLEAVHAFRAEARVPIDLPMPSITAVTEVASERLLPLFADGKIYDVLRPPLDRRALVHAAKRSCERWALQLELRWASLQLEGTASQQQRARPRLEAPEPLADVVCASAAMHRVYELIRTVAVHDVPVLLTGETGTGKELAARQIHALSKRAATPFLALDCGALTETLLESELFGHVRGAFTGATTDHPGLFQIADGGTIFLDEIQNTSPALQAKLLRVVEQGEVRPVGGTKPRRTDVRLIAACNVDLKEAVRQQRFRADFYYRLNRFPIELPPLRDHADDVIPLARHFVGSICESLGRPVQRIDPRAEAALLAFNWPGNVRELKNVIERSLLLTPADEPLRWETLPDDVRAVAASPTLDARGLDAQVAELERRLIQLALERNDGIVRRAARDLQMNAITLARKMKKLGVAAR